jgi:DNA-binding LacI/PurR family transcriptional regulator
MAERATRLLLDRIDGRETGGPYRLIIPTALVRRATA